MGHSRVGMLPNTAPWRKVVGLVAGNAPVPVVATATTEAAHLGLELADGDPGLCHAFYLLSQVVLAARQENLSEALAELGIKIPAQPSVLDVAAGFTEAVDKHLQSTWSRTDVGEMAQLAAAESLTAVLSDRASSLFGATSAELQDAIRGCSTPTGFSSLAHDFFSRFTQRFLTYHLSRELSNHVGEGRRFGNPREHTAFVDELKVHCREAALIVRDFAGKWHSKTTFEGGITPTKAKGFVHVALDKLRRELKIRGERGV